MCLWPQTACPSDPDCRLAGAGQGKKGGLPASLSELHRLLARALKKTEALWPTLEKAYALVHQAAHVLANHENESGQAVRERYESVLSTMREQQASRLRAAGSYCRSRGARAGAGVDGLGLAASVFFTTSLGPGRSRGVVYHA